MSENVEQHREVQAPEGQPVAFLYFNGFDLSTSLSDMGLMLMVDGRPQVRLAMSFTTAKTLAQNLMEAVQAFERLTEHELMNMDDVRNAFDKHSKSDP